MSMGSRVPRHEDHRLLTGRGRFVADHARPGALHAAFVRSDYAHAVIAGIDVSAALEVPGVVAVLTAADLPAVTLSSARHPLLYPTPQPILAAEQVRFVGEAVAVVLATSRYAAEDGVELVALDYEPLDVAIDAEAEPSPAAVLFEAAPGNIVFDETKEFGDTEPAFAHAAHVVRRTLDFGRQCASPLETRGCIATYDRVTKQLDVIASTQSPHLMRRKLAKATGVPEHLIVVHVGDVGGAFGQKLPLHPEEAVVALAAMHLDTTVKWVEDRRENLLAAPQAREQHITVELALDHEGRFLALRSDVLGDGGAYSFNVGTALTESYLSARSMCGPYRVGAYQYRARVRLTNKPPIAPYRGVGHVDAQVIRELLIDDAARVMGIDPVVLRRLNLVRTEDFPFTNPLGLIYDSGSYVECLDAAVTKLLDGAIDHSGTRANGKRIGIGVSSFVEPTAPGSYLVEQVWATPSNESDSVRVSLDQSGRATVAIGTPSQGQGIETTIAQVVAEELGIPLEDVIVVFGDTRAAPLSVTGTRSSRTAVITGGAAARAAAEVRTSVLRVAAQMLETAPENIVIEGRHLSARGAGTASVSLEDVINTGLVSRRIRAHAGEPTFSATKPFDPPGATYANGSIAVLVEVDPVSGGVELLRAVVAHDCGTVINPAIVEGQVVGAMMQGFGGALFEELSFGADGQPLSTSYLDYLLPTSSDTVSPELIHFTSPSPNTWRGVKGTAEAGTIGMTAAVVCAVANAAADAAPLIRRVPLRPSAVAALFPMPAISAPSRRSEVD